MKSFPRNRRNLEMIPTVAIRAAFANKSEKDSLNAEVKLLPFMATTIYAFLHSFVQLRREVTKTDNIPIEKLEAFLEAPEKALDTSNDHTDDRIGFL